MSEFELHSPVVPVSTREVTGSHTLDQPRVVTCLLAEEAGDTCLSHWTGLSCVLRSTVWWTTVPLSLTGLNELPEFLDSFAAWGSVKLMGFRIKKGRFPVGRWEAGEPPFPPCCDLSVEQNSVAFRPLESFLTSPTAAVGTDRITLYFCHVLLGFSQQPWLPSDPLRLGSVLW